MTDLQGQAHLLVLADDLTGAADSAARCRHAGLPAAIYMRPQFSWRDGSVSAIATDSRHLSPRAAYARVRQVVDDILDTWQSAESILWYKKIDSTLRGNLGAELDALLDSFAAQGKVEPPIIISPGFPAQARGLVQGYLVHEGTRPRSVHLPTLLAEQTTRGVAAISLDNVRAGADTLRGAFDRAVQEGAQLLVVDGMSDADLRQMVTIGRDSLPNAFFCGSAGLVGVLAAELAASEVDTSVDRGKLPVGSVVIVVGSGSPMARRQVEALQAQPMVTTLQVGTVGTSESGEVAMDVNSLVAGPAGQENWLLHLPEPDADTVLEGPVARAMVQALAARAVDLLEQIKPVALIVAGGDTAIHLLGALEIECLEVLRELLPGMPLALGKRGVGGNGGEQFVILKAGNHGTETTLVELLGLIRTEQ